MGGCIALRCWRKPTICQAGGAWVVTCAPVGFSSGAALAAVAQRLFSATARRHCCWCGAGEALQRSLPWGVAGCSARRPTRFFAPPKKWGKKGGPYDGGPRFARTARVAI